jgi:hypothetical protein
MKITKLLIITTCVILLLLIVAQTIDITWSSKVIFKSIQPAEINYGSFDPYCFLVVKENKTFHERLKIIIVNKQLVDSGGDYGFHMNYFDDYYNEYIKSEELKRAKVIWKSDGVTFEIPMLIWTNKGNDFDKKYKLFIPKESFIGGR